jgi:hypothetical protein
MASLILYIFVVTKGVKNFVIFPNFAIVAFFLFNDAAKQSE